MRSNVMILGILIVLLCLVASVYAQETHEGRQQSADTVAAKMKSELGLSQDEANAIKPIIQDMMAKRQALKAGVENGSIDKSTIRGQMQQLKDEEKQKLSQILTADEMSKWQSMQDQMKQKHGGHRHGGQGGSFGS